MHNLPFKNNQQKAEDILDIVHTDLNGPHQITGYHGEKYFLSFIASELTANWFKFIVSDQRMRSMTT
jgi:hypothetical protein